MTVSVRVTVLCRIFTVAAAEAAVEVTAMLPPPAPTVGPVTGGMAEGLAAVRVTVRSSVASESPSSLMRMVMVPEEEPAGMTSSPLVLVLASVAAVRSV